LNCFRFYSNIANPTKLVRADFFISFQPGKDGPVRAHSKVLTAALGRLRHAVRPVRPSLYLPRGLLPAAACRRAVFAAVRRPQLRFRLVEQICADQGPDRRAAKDQTRCEACAPKLTPLPRPAARCRLLPRFFCGCLTPPGGFWAGGADLRRPRA